MGTVGTALLLVNLCGVPNFECGVVANPKALEVSMMARFKVELAQTVIERATVWIEASTEGRGAKAGE